MILDAIVTWFCDSVSYLLCAISLFRVQLWQLPVGDIQILGIYMSSTGFDAFFVVVYVYAECIIIKVLPVYKLKSLLWNLQHFQAEIFFYAKVELFYIYKYVPVVPYAGNFLKSIHFNSTLQITV